MSDGLLGSIRRMLTPAPKATPEDGPAHIRLIVGIGNHGKEYAGNRHNVGYWTVNRLARKHNIELEAGGRASTGRGTISGRDVALAKPRTFVNQSGKVIWDLVKRFELDDARELMIVYDDLDLPVGKVRLRARGGSAGQKGMQSIIDAVHSDEFARLRIGIGRPVVQGKPSWDPAAVGDYVLSDPPPAERDALDDAVARAIEAIEVAIADGIEAAMQKYN